MYEYLQVHIITRAAHEYVGNVKQKCHCNMKLSFEALRAMDSVPKISKFLMSAYFIFGSFRD
jgi:hypothetical protein